MLEDIASIRSIRLTIPPERVSTYRAWKAAADLDYLRVQLERMGWADAVRLGDERGMWRLTELPAPGEAEPRYGTFGGGFPFIFRPARDGCRLTIEAPPLIMLSLTAGQRELPPVAAPLELDVEPLQLLGLTLDTPGGYGVLEERPDDPALPWLFGLTGQMLERLVGWGWDAAVPAAYAYTFIPTNVGCMASVSDERSGAVIGLTDDDNP